MKVLFTSTPGTGHIHPLVPLAVAFTEVADTRLLGEDGHVIDAGNDRGVQPIDSGRRRMHAEA